MTTFGFPDIKISNRSIYFNKKTNDAATTSQDWYIWNKPKNINMVHIFCLGGGDGGGAGFSGAAGTTRGGGGSGASSPSSSLLIPASFLPNKLMVSPGRGGVGGVNSAGSFGMASFVAILDLRYLNSDFMGTYAGGSGGDMDFNEFVILCSQSQASLYGETTFTKSLGGAVGTASGAAAGATLYPVFSVQTYSAAGILDTAAGLAGRAGGNATGAVGGAISSVGVNFSPGGGGGGVGTNNTGQKGGQQPVVGVAPNVIFPTVISPVVGSTDINGQNGAWRWDLLSGIGGCGGGSHGTATGGNGGNGAFGCGGGGGGGGVTGGNGGNGGSGLVIITSW